jgi:hypothetical protein
MYVYKTWKKSNFEEKFQETVSMTILDKNISVEEFKNTPVEVQNFQYQFK